VISVGKVAITMSVRPAADIDLKIIEDLVRNQISNYEDVEIKSVREKPIAFGLKVLELLIIIPDSEGGTDKIEKELSELEGVENVTIEDTTLL